MKYFYNPSVFKFALVFLSYIIMACQPKDLSQAERDEQFEKQLVINEVVASNRTGLQRVDGGEPCDWLEIKNVAKEPVSLKGYVLLVTNAPKESTATDTPATQQEQQEYFRRLKELDLGLEDRMKAKVGLLSGGQRQALTLMMATFKPPKLLLLDEHTAALDPATAEKVLAITRQTAAENHITTLMVTHNMHQALELGNRTLMMDSGRIVLDVAGDERSKRTVDELLAQYKVGAGKAVDTDRSLLAGV